jgi:prepilin-type processing-associated H-X9-DG protein
MLAWQYYADDNKGWLVSGWPARTTKFVPWFLGPEWASVGGGFRGPYGNTEAAIRDGALFKYMRNPKAYHDPGDFGWHLVSYGINGWLNGEGSPGAKPTIVTKREDIKRSSEIWVFIDENDVRDPGFTINAYNKGSFMVPRTGTTWIDVPGTWHSSGCNIAFVDSHVEYKRWVDKSTLDHATNPGYGFNGAGANDLKWLQAKTAPLP